MHEMSLMMNLMRTIHTIAQAESASRVTVVRVKLGALSHMSPSHFKEHFDEVAKGTLAEGARLEAEVMTDTEDPNAQEILLESIDVED